MLIVQNTTLTAYDPIDIDWPWTQEDELDLYPKSLDLKGHIGSGSGGYADHIFHYAANELFGEENSTLTYKTMR